MPEITESRTVRQDGSSGMVRSDGSPRWTEIGSPGANPKALDGRRKGAGWSLLDGIVNISM